MDDMKLKMKDFLLDHDLAGDVMQRLVPVRMNVTNSKLPAYIGRKMIQWCLHLLCVQGRTFSVMSWCGGVILFPSMHPVHVIRLVCRKF